MQLIVFFFFFSFSFSLPIFSFMIKKNDKYEKKIKIIDKFFFVINNLEKINLKKEREREKKFKNHSQIIYTVVLPQIKNKKY